MSTSTNLYLCGVGGQGIGMLNELLVRACRAAGHTVRGVETHGLAQRGGVVRAHLRIGEGVYTPRIPPNSAQIVLGLERLEALRGAQEMLADGGTLVYYDTMQQPSLARRALGSYPTAEELATSLGARGVRVERVALEGTPERMQNVAILARVASLGLIAGLDLAVARTVLAEIVPAVALARNQSIFERAASGV